MCNNVKSTISKWGFSLLLMPFICLSFQAKTDEVGGPIRPLANDYVIVKKSPNPKKIPLYNPTIVSLRPGYLVAGYFFSNRYAKDVSGRGMHFLTSADGGQTWIERAVFEEMSQARLFVAGKSIYALGSGKGLPIARSDDDGVTWSESVSLRPGVGGWHQTASNYIISKGNIYLVIERRAEDELTTWPVGELAPVMMRARADADLLKPESWSYSSEIIVKNIIPGYREDNIELDYFGVPFFPHTFPGNTKPAKGRGCAPVGWLEANVAQITDPNHYWYDPAGKTFHILMRGHTGGTGYAALAKVVENDDGTMTTGLETVPSGKKALFLPMPGGQMRFHILYDETSKLYWLLGSQSTDSMTRADLLPAERYNLPNNERHRLVLHFSKNLVDWCFAGVVAIGKSPVQARHYASMAIDGDDLVVLSRSGDKNAKSAHDGNIITFHRVRDFRSLAY